MPFRWNRGRLLCSQCSMTFVTIASLREHSIEHATSHALPTLYKQSSLEFIKIDISDLKCILCSEKVSNLQSLKTHLANKHSKPLSLDVGDGLIPFTLDHDEFSCVHCGVIFVTFMKLMIHMNSHYQRHICDCCGRGFASRSQLRKHKLMQEKGEFPCNKCNSVFKNRSLRNNHVAQAHGSEHRYRCPQCSETFLHYASRIKHLKHVHEVNIEYHCPVCHAVFLTRNSRTSHLKHVHIRKKTHMCTECPASFITSSDLRSHMIRHNGERKFQCTVCNKKYARRKTLKEHMRIHNNDRRFICEICSQAFVQNCSLKQHKRVHHPESTVAP